MGKHAVGPTSAATRSSQTNDSIKIGQTDGQIIVFPPAVVC